MGTSNNIGFTFLANALLSVIRPIIVLLPISILVILVNLLILGLLIIG